MERTAFPISELIEALALRGDKGQAEWVGGVDGDPVRAMLSWNTVPGDEMAGIEGSIIGPGGTVVAFQANPTQIPLPFNPETRGRQWRHYWEVTDNDNPDDRPAGIIALRRFADLVHDLQDIS